MQNENSGTNMILLKKKLELKNWIFPVLNKQICPHGNLPYVKKNWGESFLKILLNLYLTSFM